MQSLVLSRNTVVYQNCDKKGIAYFSGRKRNGLAKRGKFAKSTKGLQLIIQILSGILQED